MTVKQLRLLNDICTILDVRADHFVNTDTGVVRPHLQELITLRMSELGIYSFTELGRRLGWESPGVIADRVRRLDAQATKDNEQFEKTAW